jgi:hypothetical protein
MVQTGVERGMQMLLLTAVQLLVPFAASGAACNLQAEHCDNISGSPCWLNAQKQATSTWQAATGNPVCARVSYRTLRRSHLAPVPLGKQSTLMMSVHPLVTQGVSQGTGCKTPAWWHSWSHHTSQMHRLQSTAQHGDGREAASGAG